MGRNKGINNTNSTTEKINSESQNNSYEKSSEEIIDYNSIRGENQNTDCAGTKILKKTSLNNSIQSSNKKDEDKTHIIEVKRSRGRPRKNLSELGAQKSLDKSYETENKDILKFENEVYESENSFLNQDQNTIEHFKMLPLETLKTSESVKQYSNIDTSFGLEAKINTESIITISSEENSNSNPIIRALQNTPTSERNLSSPDVLQVQFNPSSTKTYKNKRKFVNALAIKSDINSLADCNKDDINIVDEKNQTSKPSPTFEVNPNFVRNTRKKVLKYDVCDLLNKKSHKKIQIEARIDSMPCKSKLNCSKLSEINLVNELAKSEASPIKIVPKINELPSIIQKNLPSDGEIQDQKSSPIFLNIVEQQISSPKSLIQIQGKIVAENTSSGTKNVFSQESSLRTNISIPNCDEKKQMLTASDGFCIKTESQVKRRPGRPKIKKDVKLNISMLSAHNVLCKSPKNEHQHIVHGIDKEKNDSESEFEVTADSNQFPHEQYNTNLHENKEKILLPISSKGLASKSSTNMMDSLACDNFILNETAEARETEPKDTELKDKQKDLVCSPVLAKKNETFTNRNDIEINCLNPTLFYLNHNKEETKAKVVDGEKSKTMNSDFVQKKREYNDDTSLFSINNFKEVRVLIKGKDTVKIKKIENFSPEKATVSINTFISNIEKKQNIEKFIVKENKTTQEGRITSSKTINTNLEDNKEIDFILEKPTKRISIEEKIDLIKKETSEGLNTIESAKEYKEKLCALNYDCSKEKKINIDKCNVSRIDNSLGQTDITETQREEKFSNEINKTKELKTGMDIWLEKVQQDSKNKNFFDSTKKNKFEKIPKQKSKDCNKPVSENKNYLDFLSKSDSMLKNDNKIKDLSFDKDSGLANDFKKKEIKDKYENKNKNTVFKIDFKSLDESKTKDPKDSKTDKKLKEKEDPKIKYETKIENKIKVDCAQIKNISNVDKEEVKPIPDTKFDKIEPCVNQFGKNETTLKTIDIFNFAAKDEMVNKVHRKKVKRPETSTPISEKNQQCKFNLNHSFLDISSNKEKQLESIRLSSENPVSFKNLEELHNKEKTIVNIRNETVTSDQIPEPCRSICEKDKFLMSSENIPFKEQNQCQNSNEEITLFKNEFEQNAKNQSVDHENHKIQNVNNVTIAISETKVKDQVLEPKIENLKNDLESTEIETSIEKIESDRIKTEEFETNNQIIALKNLKSSTPNANDSTNEVLDPLKDIESFLEAAGNLLSRSHSSDDEKESMARRGSRSRQADPIETNLTNEQQTAPTEVQMTSPKSDRNAESVCEKVYTVQSDDFQNMSDESKKDIKSISESEELCVTQKTNLIALLENTTSHDREYRPHKPHTDHNSTDLNKCFDEIPLPSKKLGTGPRTPPMPSPSADNEQSKVKGLEKNILDDKNLVAYENSRLNCEIANSIISTSVKVPSSLVTSLTELKFIGSPKNENRILDEHLKMIENQIYTKSKKKSEASQKDKEIKKFLKTLKKNDLSGDWKKTYKELKKIKKKSAVNLAGSKSNFKYTEENENLDYSEKNKICSENQNENATIRRSHRLKSIALQQQNQQIAIGRGGIVRNDYEDLIRPDLAQVQAQNTKFLKAMDNSPNQFKQIKENEYKCEHVISKEAKRMVCDCFLTRDEEERGEYGCGDDCLNRLLMIECGPKCNVNDRCTNKRFQRGQYAPCRVFMTEKKGCGIYAEVEIPAGEFIMEYVGEVVDSEQFEKRAEEYSAHKNKHFYFMSLRSNAIIDATARGNISRFINHSCDPNAETQKWTVNGELRIGFFTTRTVAAGEEITFDYQFQRYGKQAQKCYCESANCRGWIGEEPDSDEEIEEETESAFKTKEDLERISREIQAFADKPSHFDQNIEDEQKLLSRKDKTALTEEQLKIKQQEREQRKKDKQRKREIRLAQKKHDFLEDPDLEDEIYRLSKTGLKNQVQTLRLSRLIVRAKLLQTRINLLEILRAGEIPCRRLFLDYHGLKLLHGWMNESESKDSAQTEDNLKMRFAVLETLNCLPIPNKTMLKESKVYQIIQSWAQDKSNTISPTDGSASDSNSSQPIPVKEKSNDLALDPNSKEIQIENKRLALKLLNDWEVLPEVFRIPRKERVEQMKEHEREADRRYAALHVADDENESKSSRDRYKKSRWDSSVKQRWPKQDVNKDRRKESEKFDDGLTKEQRRQAFAAKVAQDEAEKLNAEKRRNMEFEARREFEFKCKFFLLDCTKTHSRDIPFCVDQKTNSWYTLDKRKIPTPPSHIHIKVPVKLKSTNPADYKLPQLDLPQGWKFAIEPKCGRIYYYHAKIRRPQWEPPPKIHPLINPENNANIPQNANNTSKNCENNNDSETSGSDSESVDESDAFSLLVQERAISPRKEEDRVYNQIEMRRYKENKEKIRRRKEEIKRRKLRLLLKSGEQISEENIANQLNDNNPLPIADYLISSEEEDDTIAEDLDSKLIEKIVKGESIVDELDALKTKKPLKRPLPIKEKSNGNSSNNASDSKKRLRMEDKKHKTGEEYKKSKTGGKNSKYFARKAKEKFRSDIAGIIVQHLQPYRKDSCLIGKITTNEDFKHLARKLTHFVMIKELKHCDSTGQTLIVTDSVKNKSREFIKKYMAKYGEMYIRPESDPEYKEIPM